MKNPFRNINRSASRFVTPILVGGILLFAGLTAFVNIVAYKKEKVEIENYSQSLMRALVLDMDGKMMAIETAVSTAKHMSATNVKDSAAIYARLCQLMDDCDYLYNTAVDLWEINTPDSVCTTFYVQRKTDGDGYLCFSKVNGNEVFNAKEEYACQKSHRTGDTVWSLPYDDDIFANALVATCVTNVPGKDVQICADVTIASFLENLEQLIAYDNTAVLIHTPDNDKYYALIDGKLATVDYADYCAEDRTEYSIYYDRIGTDIICTVPDKLIVDPLWKNVFIGLAIFILVLTGLAVFVHKSYVRAQRDLAESLRKANEEEIARRALDNDLAIAARIQKKMLSTQGKTVRFDIDGRTSELYAELMPAREVGGDFYEYRRVGDLLYMCMGDVSGKGIASSIVMAIATTLFNAHINSGRCTGPGEMISFINRQFCDRNDAMMFVTMWVGILDLKTGVLRYASAGHNPAVKISGDGASFIETVPELPMGISCDVEYRDMTTAMSAGDSLLLYTDGVTEAEAVDGSLFGDARLLAAVSGSTASDVCASVLSAVSAFADGRDQSDDIALLSITL